jgi:hypothetical protein
VCSQQGRGAIDGGGARDGGVLVPHVPVSAVHPASPFDVDMGIPGGLMICSTRGGANYDEAQGEFVCHQVRWGNCKSRFLEASNGVFWPCPKTRKSLVLGC